MSMSENADRPCRACSGTGYRGLDDCSDCGCTGTITVAPARPLADPTETLALIAEHQLTVMPHEKDGWWLSGQRFGPHSADGPTIADAVRAAVSRIRGQQ